MSAGHCHVCSRRCGDDLCLSCEEEYLAEESEANYEPGPYVAPFVFGRPPGWQPAVTYGYGEW